MVVSLFCHRDDVVMRRACFYCFRLSTYNFALFFNFYQHLIVQISTILFIITFNFLFLGSLKLSGLVGSLSVVLTQRLTLPKGRWLLIFQIRVLYSGTGDCCPLASLYFSPSTISVPFSLLSVSITLCDQEYYLLHKMLLGLLFLYFILLSHLSLVFSFHFTLVTWV